MSGPEFFQTMMGRKFYERDVPDISKTLNRIADALEKQNELMEKQMQLAESIDRPDYDEEIPFTVYPKSFPHLVKHQIVIAINKACKNHDAHFCEILETDLYMDGKPVVYVRFLDESYENGKRTYITSEECGLGYVPREDIQIVEIDEL